MRQVYGRVVSLVCVSCVLGVTDAAAQDDGGMTEEQINLLNRANESLAQTPPDLDRAHTAIRAALDAGDEYDVLLLTYGRVLQLRDECTESKAVFNKLGFAKHVEAVSREDIERIRTTYLEQMEQRCSAELTVECAVQETSIEVSGQSMACGETIKLKPGGYSIVASLDATSKEYDVVLKGAEQKSFNIALKRGEVAVGDPDPDPVEPVTSPDYTGAIVAGVATVVVTGAAVGVWAYASGQQQTLIDANTNEDGTWRADLDEERRATLTDEINGWGTTEVGAGWAVPAVFVVGAVTTGALAWMAGAEQPAVSLGIDPVTGSASGVIRFTW